MRKPEARYAPAPLYSELWQQAARRWAQRPVAFRQQWQEHPSPAFILCLVLILGGIISIALAAAGLIGKPASHLLARNEIPRLAADLIGSSADATRNLLGKPAMVRHEPPAEVWQYRSGNCVLDVYVYATVTHAEIRERNSASANLAGDTVDRNCLKALRQSALR